MGAAYFAWPFIDSMNPAADILAQSTVDVDIIIHPCQGKRLRSFGGASLFLYDIERLKEIKDSRTSPLVTAD